MTGDKTSGTEQKSISEKHFLKFYQTVWSEEKSENLPLQRFHKRKKRICFGK